MYTWEILQTAYQAATEEQRGVIDSDVIPVCVKEALAEKQMPRDVSVKLVRICALYNLGNLEEGAAIQAMTQLGFTDASQLFSDLQSCIMAQHTPSQTEVDISADISAEIAEAEAVIEQAETKAIPHIRTMAGDMNRAQATPTDEEPIHSSSQDSLLKR